MSTNTFEISLTVRQHTNMQHFIRAYQAKGYVVEAIMYGLSYDNEKIMAIIKTDKRDIKLIWNDFFDRFREIY